MVTAAATLAPMGQRDDLSITWDAGDVIRKLRKKRGLTQIELADRAGVHKNTIVRIEDGDEGVTGKTLRAVAHALGVTVAQIYKLIPETDPTRETQRSAADNRPAAPDAAETPFQKKADR